MATLTPYYQNLVGSYLFAEIARRVQAHAAQKTDSPIIRLGIGDVTTPLVPAVVSALHKAVDEQATAEGFRGYGPEQGYAFLREAIVRDCYSHLDIEADEVFVSDGAKCDIGNFQELFDQSCRVAITDPVYPVYVDSNVMAGRTGRCTEGAFEGLLYLPCTAENGFVPSLPQERPDIIYLCFPNNPTGTVLRREQLQNWVDYARENECVILFDAAYDAYIRTPGIPHSIYELPGAKEVAVEFRSYSKGAGFTGLRCGYVVVPKTVKGRLADGSGQSLHSLWLRRQTTKYNGCPYIIQRAAEAVHTPEGKAQCRAIIDKYMVNAECIRNAFSKMGLSVYGGVDAPYVWVKLPEGMDSWKFFDLLLRQANIVGTPGAGFGPSGEGYFRLTGFGRAEDTQEAAMRLSRLAL